MLLKKCETIQRKAVIVKIINTARETREDRATLKQEWHASQKKQSTNKRSALDSLIGLDSRKGSEGRHQWKGWKVR